MSTVVSVREHYKYPTQCIGLIQNGHRHHYHLNDSCSRHDVSENLLNWHQREIDVSFNKLHYVRNVNFKH
jgi:hypothetical protein